MCPSPHTFDASLLLSAEVGCSCNMILLPLPPSKHKGALQKWSYRLYDEFILLFQQMKSLSLSIRGCPNATLRLPMLASPTRFPADAWTTVPPMGQWLHTQRHRRAICIEIGRSPQRPVAGKKVKTPRTQWLEDRPSPIHDLLLCFFPFRNASTTTPGPPTRHRQPLCPIRTWARPAARFPRPRRCRRHRLRLWKASGRTGSDRRRGSDGQKWNLRDQRNWRHLGSWLRHGHWR